MCSSIPTRVRWKVDVMASAFKDKTSGAPENVSGCNCSSQELDERFMSLQEPSSNKMINEEPQV